MEYTGCGTWSFDGQQLESFWKQKYSGLFQRGFSENEIKPFLRDGFDFEELLVKCARDTNKLQFATQTVEELRGQLKQRGISEQISGQIVRVYETHIDNPDKILKYFLSIHPLMEKLRENWYKSDISNFRLTSVGIAIGHANLRCRTGLDADIGTWIN
jgi:hypothetical protein